MNEFEKALVSDTYCKDTIPKERNWFEPLIGSWDFTWIDNNAKKHREVQGEWIFSWILEGIGIQDMFICPSRKARITHPQPDEEYGTTLRIYNPKTLNWDISYCCLGRVLTLEAKKEDDSIVLTNTLDNTRKWVFVSIEQNSFHWQNVSVKEDGSWHINSDIHATRVINQS
ncbi:hypothetical protein [Breznakia pachnodae]|uniref:Uncharacterized protein n=1 Tax=Breznakia pachnodae TaxID=265178 RepID=A0ABU0E959_9FIRM|nr:hypothetical protein [Breznakia pachnodae]MDQ0363261.1 hypothetical protein [Breznakia pachnodae]